MKKVTYDRPVEAELHVHLADGATTWPATAVDLEKFGLVDRHGAYMVFDDRLGEILAQAGLIRRDVTDAHLNPVRYLVETAVVHPDLMDHPEHEGWRTVVELERILQSFARGVEDVDVADAAGALDIDLSDADAARIAEYLTKRLRGRAQLADEAGS